MGRGGARVGAGRKPSKFRTQRVFVRPNDAPAALAAVETMTPRSRVSDEVSAIPPEDLPAEQRDFWHRYAAMAIEKRTLTVHTVAAFLLLCELDAEKRATKAAMDADGRTFLKVTVDGAGVEHQELKAHPLTGAYGRLAKAVEALMARFGLAPFGKAELPMVKKAAVNQWAQVAQK